MASHLLRRIGGFGAVLVSVALGTVPSVWPELIRPHPYWVAAIASSGVLLVVTSWVTLSAEGSTDPMTVIYKVGPKSKSGPLQMTEVPT